jgi:hypothetical protein
MSVDYCMPQPIAQWNPIRQLWETDQTELFCEQQEPFSVTWPTSGMTLGGRLFPLRRLEPRTSGNEFSSLQGLLLPTPRQRDFKGPGRAKTTQGGESLPTIVTKLLPTPSSADGLGGHLSRSGDRRDELLLRGIAKLLPTPSAADADGHISRSGDRIDEPLLGGVVKLLPSPSASDGDCTGGPSNPANRKAGGSQRHQVQLLDLGVAPPEMWQEYAPAIERWAVLTRPAPDPTEPNKMGTPRLSAKFDEWMMGWPKGHVTEVEGIPYREQLRIAGNGVVVQQAVAALAMILDTWD